MPRPLSVLILISLLLLPAAPVHAQDDIVEKTYCTQGIAYESIDALKLDLLNNAKKAVINELFGEFIVASTAVENFVVTKDQIQTSSLGFVRVEGNTKFHNGDDFADVCVTIEGYVTTEDRAKFDPEPLDNKYCDADDDMTTAQLIAYVKDEVIIQALIEHEPKLKGADKDSLLQLVQKVNYVESDFIPDTQTYCATFEGEVVPVEVMAFLESDSLLQPEQAPSTQKKEDLPISSSKGGKFSSPELWVNFYGYESGNWRLPEHPRMMADVNGDGKADVVGFGNEGVYVSLSTKNQFTEPQIWIEDYVETAGGWRPDMHPRTMADVNGDGKADVVGFGYFGVSVALSNGSEFAKSEIWIEDFGYRPEAGEWRVDTHPRMMADVNGDSKADVIGFGDEGVYVSLSTGREFTKSIIWTGGYRDYRQVEGGWSTAMHIRTMADVNGDGKADVVGFGHFGVSVALSNGSEFTKPEDWIKDYGYEQAAGGWIIDVNPRMMADVNGDSMEDIVGFGNEGVYVSLSIGSEFAEPKVWIEDYTQAGGEWNVSVHPRMVADVNGDGKADIVGFGNTGVYVSLAVSLPS